MEDLSEAGYDEIGRILCRELSGFPAGAKGDEKSRRLRPWFTKANNSEKTKMLFFLIINTDFEGKRDLKHLDSLNFLIDICPNLTLDDLREIITELRLIDALCDVIRKCNFPIWSDIVRSFTWNLDDPEIREHYLKLAVALYAKYCDVLLKLGSDHAACVFNLFLEFLPTRRWNYGMHFKGPASIDVWRKMLNCCNLELQLWGHCFDSMNLEDLSNQKCFQYASGKAIDHSEVSKRVVKQREQIGKYFSQFLTICKDFWSRPLDSCLLDGDFPSEKKLICKNAHFLYEIIKGRNVIEPEEEKWLEELKREADISSLVGEIRFNEAPKFWLEKLINYPKWFENEEIVSNVANHSHVMDSDECKIVLESLQSSKFDGKIQEIYMRCFEKMTLDDQIYYFNKNFDYYRNFHFEFSDDELTEKFNRFSESDDDIRKWLITMCIKSPLKTIKNLCKLALSNSKTFHDCLRSLEMLRRACLSKESEDDDLDVITSVVKSLAEDEELTNCEEHSLIRFTSKLHETQLLHFKFVTFSVLKLIQVAFVSENFGKAIFALELFKSWLKLRIFVDSSDAIVLTAFAARVLSHASWNCSTFSMELVQARELVIAIIELLINSPRNANDVEVAWLRREILTSSQLNRLYFYDFLFPDDCNVITSKHLYIQLFALIHTKTKANSIIRSLVTKLRSKKLIEFRVYFIYALIRLLPLLTREEWTTIFTQLKSIVTALSEAGGHPEMRNPGLVVVDFLTVSMYCLAQDMNRSGDMTSCFEFCIRNYGRVVQMNFPFDEMVESNVRIELAKKMLFLLNGIRDSECRKANSMILSSVILGITDCATGNTGNDCCLRRLEDCFRKDFIQQ